MIKNIRHTCLIVDDIAKTHQFYSDILELKLISSGFEKDKFIKNLLNLSQLCWAKYITENGNILEFYFMSNCPSSSFAHVSFTVDNIKKLRNKLIKNKIQCSTIEINKTKTCKIMFCRDPFQNLIEFVEDIK